MADSNPTTFVLALTRLDGVGRVTARRLSERFATYDALRDHPREQVFLRIKGLPNAEQITKRLFEDERMGAALAEAETEQKGLAERGVHLLSPHSEAWPDGLDALPPAERPLLLWAYGPTGVLQRSAAALLARPPLEEAPFERAQALAQYLTAEGILLAVGAQSGFDVALAKRAAADGAPIVLTAACGLGKLPRRLRPIASQAVRAGGVLLSPFSMQHGPFDHDDRERAKVQAALAQACIFAPPAPGTPEAGALAWARAATRPAFFLGKETPPDAHAVRSPDDFPAVLEAVRNAAQNRPDTNADPRQASQKP